MDLGIWIIISALVGAKAMLLIVERRQVRLELERARQPVSLRRRVLRRTDRRSRRRALLPLAPPHAGVDRHRRLRAGHRARPRHRPARLPLRRLLLRTPDGRCRGRITFHSEYAAQNVGTTLDIPLHPTQLYEAGAELLILAVLLLTEKKGRPFPGRTFWSYMLLYGVSQVHHRVLPRRLARHDGFSTDVTLDVAVRIPSHRAARHRDAGAARPPWRPGAGGHGDPASQGSVRAW